MNTKKYAENVLKVCVKFLANFFGVFIKRFLYTRVWFMQDLSFKKYTLSYHRFSTLINRVMRISYYLWCLNKIVC